MRCFAFLKMGGLARLHRPGDPRHSLTGEHGKARQGIGEAWLGSVLVW